MVVFVGEGVELGLELGEGGGFGLFLQPAFEGLVEAFDFPAGGGVVGGGVDLADLQAAEFGFEAVASAAAAGQPGGEDHAVVGEGGVWDAMGCGGFGEFGQDDRCGDAPVCGQGDGVAGVVVDPAEDLYVGTAGEAPVGEVGLPAFAWVVRRRTGCRTIWAASAVGV